MISSILDASRPWMSLLALLPLVYYLFFKFVRVKKSSIVFSDISYIPQITNFRTQTLFIPKLLGLLAWVIFVVALMGPREGHQESKITTEGIAISMVMDISGSMKEVDMPTEDGKVISRYAMVQQVFTDFVNGNEKKGLSGRSNDLISLIVFGQYVDDLCPLVLDHAFLLDMMNNTINSVTADIANFEKTQTQVGNQRVQQMMAKKNPIWGGTAIYEGVAMGADVVRKSEQALKEAKENKIGNYSIKSKILIVLTDGEDTASEISAEDAVKVAKEFGVKIYAIAVHGKPVRRDITGFFIRGGGKEYDDSNLELMANESGGKFFKASDPESLVKIYQEINNLEKSEISKQVTMEYSPVHRPWLMAGLIFLGLAILLNTTYYRVLP